MRQRIKLAQSIAHDPRVLVLDEPLNGLDPMARAETIALFQEWGANGRHVIVSSHILHEVDRISDQVILLSHGYVVAEGQIQGVRSEVKEQPMQIVVRCDRPNDLAARLFLEGHLVEAKIAAGSLLLRTRDADSFYLLLNRVITRFRPDSGIGSAGRRRRQRRLSILDRRRRSHGMSRTWRRPPGLRASVTCSNGRKRGPAKPDRRRLPPGMEEDIPLAPRLVDLHSGRRSGRHNRAALADTRRVSGSAGTP